MRGARLVGGGLAQNGHPRGGQSGVDLVEQAAETRRSLTANWRPIQKAAVRGSAQPDGGVELALSSRNLNCQTPHFWKGYVCCARLTSSPTTTELHRDTSLPSS